MGWRTDRTVNELTDTWEALLASYQEKSFPKDILHFYVDIAKEIFEHAPYTSAHVLMSVVIPVSIVYQLFS